VAIRKGVPLTFRPIGLSDALDGSNVPLGAMSSLSNLVPAPSTPNVFVARPASTSLTTFAGFTTPAGVTALLVLGTRAYGMISSAAFAGKDQPFCYDIANNVFIAISGQLSANLPATQSLTGDWVPPKMEAVTQSRIIVTHPGFPGGAGAYFGWIDISSFSSTTVTGNTHTSTLVDNLSTNVLQAGWAVGMTVTGAGVPAGTTIASIASPGGLSVTLSQATTATAAGVALTVAGGTPAAPLWGAGNTTGNPLTAVPKSVAGFSGRAYYAVANALVFSDSLNPTQVTNATQALVLGDNQDITAVVGEPLTSQVSGGVIEALVAFKGAGAFYQITGDSATGNLASNVVNGSVGTFAPNTLCATPLGIAYVAVDGVRILGFSGTLSEPIGAYGLGVNVPFLNALNPSRMCAAFNQNVLRITVRNNAALNQPYQEYWYDFNQKIWTGPHTFGSTLIQPYNGASTGFVAAAVGVDAKLWLSTCVPTSASVYTENGVALSWSFQTCLMPDNEQMAMNAIVETEYVVASPSGQVITIQALDEGSTQLAVVTQTGGGTGSTVWGGFNWGSAVWGAAAGYLRLTRVAWPLPVVFKQASLLISGASVASFALGNVHLRYQPLGYMLP